MTIEITKVLISIAISLLVLLSLFFFLIHFQRSRLLLVTCPLRSHTKKGARDPIESETKPTQEVVLLVGHSQILPWCKHGSEFSQVPPCWKLFALEVSVKGEGVGSDGVRASKTFPKPHKWLDSEDGRSFRLVFISMSQFIQP